MELTSYLAVARRWWWTLLVAAWVAGAAGFLIASRISPTYEAQVQLLVGPINSDSDTLKASGLLVQTYGQLAIGAPLLKSTAQEVGGLDPVKLAQNVRSSANETTRVIAIRVQDGDAARAALIANAIADELIQLTTGATTRPEGQLQVISPALPPTAPVAPQVPLVVLLAIVAGVLAGLVLVILVEFVTDFVRDGNDLGRLTRSDLLATIAFHSRTPGVDPMPVPEATAPTSAIAASFRILASKIAFADAALATRTIAVVGIGEGDNGLVAMAVAAAVAGSGYRAVVVDGASNGDITASFGLGALAGLREGIAAGDQDIRSLLVPGPVGVRVLPRGMKGSFELVAVDRARQLLQALLSDADVVIVDGGAMQRSAGALSWARAAEQAIVVARLGTSRREEVRTAIENLRFVNANIGGVVLVQRLPGRSFGRARQRDHDLDDSALPPGSRPSRYGWPPSPDPLPAVANVHPDVLPTSQVSQASDVRVRGPRQRPVASPKERPPEDESLRQDTKPVDATPRRRRSVSPTEDGVDASSQSGGHNLPVRKHDLTSSKISSRTRRAE